MMNLVKWNPWREMPTLQNRINRMFDDPFFRVGRFTDDDSLGMWNPAVDLYEKDDHSHRSGREAFPHPVPRDRTFPYDQG